MERTIRTVRTDILEIAYAESGAPDGIPVILMHGFPYDIHAYDEASRLLAEDQAQKWHVYVPWLRGYGQTRFLSEETMRSGEQSALAYDLISFMDALSIPKAVLAGYDWGGRAAVIVSALYPDRVLGLVSCGVGYNMHNPAKWQEPALPVREAASWYMYYFNTQRGYNGLTRYRKELCRLLWERWSPEWQFTEEDYALSSAAFDNPDFVDIVTQSYRCRIGEAPEDPRYREISEGCAAQPVIRVPSIVLLGMADTISPPKEQDTDAPHFAGPYRRVLVPHAGHNLPQEQPSVLADAVREVYAM